MKISDEANTVAKQIVNEEMDLDGIEWMDAVYGVGLIVQAALNEAYYKGWSERDKVKNPKIVNLTDDPSEMFLQVPKV